MVHAFFGETGAQLQGKAKGRWTYFAQANEESIDPEEFSRTEFVNGRGAADDVATAEAVRDMPCTSQCVGAAAGESNEMKFFPAEVICQLLYDGRPIREISIGLHIGKADAGAVGANESDALLESDFVQASTIHSRQRPAMKMKGGSAQRIAEFSVGEAAARLQYGGAFDDVVHSIHA